MGKELKPPSEFLKNISPHDKEVIILATAFFYGKFNRQAVPNETFKPSLPESEAIINSPFRNKLFSHLANEEIGRICSILEEAFESDESAAETECQSLYEDVSPELFAIARTCEMLCARNKILNIRWFDIPEGLVRKAIVEAVIIEKLGREIFRFISSGETPKLS